MRCLSSLAVTSVKVRALVDLGHCCALSLQNIPVRSECPINVFRKL